MFPVLLAKQPGDVKRIGRTVRGFEESTWEQRRFEIVVEASLAKFSQNIPLGDFLRATGSQVLVEASPHDRVWGIGLAVDDAATPFPERWRGLNLLGFALMTARAGVVGGGGKA